ncbi:50S ribosomal protein L11 methyltransferase [Pelotomaculum terephthalicicum JT]|uniref:50S ribosomal protein L11 methyltransferase n=1 Tax=Pelotomaculum TaxID=191373 RepID=UPI0009C67243|nr:MULTISPECIES: 50S ribosomal protein L11 methyltransferase [Pelotomaculum]MCG9967041.1 50S ribosomal protein L11 methyltransferase [Pelotomaculum terephthalicicum JT]OPX90512.1 MAG: Ribosomal protein L11 methyltransferase [Pelotomaculum sp. PtaB.Bin117]OPY63914.1 MAG: Ribosomal protein L11 methyltransferase [Pelotomaculum sp. PtaU1.Bin065]
MDWLEITVRTLPGTVEAVAGLFEELKSGGVVIEDPAVILRYAAETHPDEWGIPGTVSGHSWPLVKSYFPADQDLDRRLCDFRQALERLALSPAPEVSTRRVADEDWANAWRAYYKPVRAGQRLVVKPCWEEWNRKEGDLVIEMEPGMAFGCGTHSTTLLCLRLLERHVRSGATVYDVGTGSGILAVAAAKLGAGRVTATDLDETACRVALENVARNQVAGIVRVVQGNLLDLVEGQADLIVSNIIADVIISLAPYASRALVPGGVLIASGIIRGRAAEVHAAMEAYGLAVRDQLGEGHWVAFVGEKC